MDVRAHRVALAGLLHDLGKLAQRASGQSPPEAGLKGAGHARYTAWLIEKYRDLFAGAEVDVDWLVATASRHQEDGSQPQTPEQWAVALANGYASNKRRNPSEGQTDRALQSIFSALTVNGVKGAPRVYAGGAGLRPGLPYPVGDTRLSPAHYQRLLEQLDQRLQELGRLGCSLEGLLSNLAMFLLEVGWGVPADTQTDLEVSLYDHLKLTAAIAAVLDAYHQQLGQLDSQSLSNESIQKFLLVVGEMGGIQKHIYRIRSASTGTGGIARRLRSRSLEVSLASEAMAAEILQQTGLPALVRIMGAGGKFYLLLPNTSGVVEVLDQTRLAWEQWGLAQGGSLVPILAHLSFSASEFPQFAEVMQRLQNQLSQAKLRPYSSQLSQPLLYPERAGTSRRPCAACDLRPALADEAGSLCRECNRDRTLGGQLPSLTSLSVQETPTAQDFRFARSGIGPQPGRYTLRARPNFTPEKAAWELRLLLGHLPRVEDALAVRQSTPEEYARWAESEGLWDSDDDWGAAARDRTLSLGELAALSKGVPYLGALMLDADRMGEAFATGFEQSSPARIAALSRAFDWFFSTEVLQLLQDATVYAGFLDGVEEKAARYRLIYTVYSGGDDLFLLGPWGVLLELAVDLEKLYQRYTQHPGLTLSGGLALLSASTPIPLLYDQVDASEKQAKKAGRNRLALFGQTVEWEKLTEMQTRALRLAAQLGDRTIPTNLAYRWLQLHREYMGGKDEALRMRYKPMLAYMMRDRKSLANEYQDLHNHQHPAWIHLPVWVQWGMYLSRRSAND